MPWTTPPPPTITTLGALRAPYPAPKERALLKQLDTRETIVATAQVGLLFLVPGVAETLRVNGTAVLSQAPPDLALCTNERRSPFAKP